MRDQAREPREDDASATDVRIAPEAALRPGTRDPLALLAVWFARKSFFWILWLGLIVGTIFTQTGEAGLEVESPQDIWGQLLSPYAGVMVALILRFGASFVALALAYPLARQHDTDLEPRTGFGSGIGRWLDRMQVARAFRSLRWTHHVRQLALARLGTTGRRLARLDPIMDIANITLFFGLIAVVALVGSDAS